MTAPSAGHALVDAFAALGVKSFFAVPGESFLEVLDAAAFDPRTRLISTRHESGASFMAEATAKLTGVPAVAMATRAVGAANLAIGVHTAYHDSTPMIALIGQVDRAARGRDGFQEIDLSAFYRPFTKWQACLENPAQARALAYRAFVAATSGRPGPVVIELPADVLRELSDEGQPDEPPVFVPAASAPPSAVVEQLRTRLAAARRPVAIVGGGAQGATVELVRLASAYGMGIYSAFRRQDVFPNNDKHYLGHLTLGTSPTLLKALRDADLVLVLGSRLSEVTSQNYTLPLPSADVIHVDIEPRSLGTAVVPSLAIPGDVRATVQALLDHPGEPAPDSRHWAPARAVYEKESTVPAESGDGNLIHPAEVIAAMAKALPADAIIANDAGNFSIFLHRYWRYVSPHTQLAPTSGAMGYGVPAAIAAKLARPDRTVVCVSGDGGFLMTGQELETAVRHDLPVVVIVMRNGLYGTIAMHQMRTFGRTAGVGIGDVDLAAYAASLGAASFSVTDREALVPAIDEAVFAGRPALVDVTIDPDVSTPTASLSQFAAGPR